MKKMKRGKFSIKNNMSLPLVLQPVTENRFLKKYHEINLMKLVEEVSLSLPCSSDRFKSDPYSTSTQIIFLAKNFILKICKFRMNN